MARVTDEFSVRFSANVSNFNSNIEKASQKMSSISSVAKKAGAAIGAAFVLRKVGQELMQASEKVGTFEKSLNELSAITGAKGKDLKDLGREAVALSGNFDDTGDAINMSANDIVNAFKLVGSAKPELLKNAEALKAVTKEAIILSQAGGDSLPLEESVKSMTKIMNQFSLGADQANRTINVLAAGSKEGAGEIPYLSEAIIKTGTAAEAAGLSLETTVGIMEVYAEKGLQAATAGVNFRNILIELQKNTDNYTAGQFDFNKALDNLKPIMSDTIALEQMFGKENVIAAQVLAQNTARVTELTAAVTGTQTAYEQSTTNMQGQAVAAEMLSNKWDAFILSVEQGSGVFGKVTNTLINMASSVISMVTPMQNVTKETAEMARADRAAAIYLKAMTDEYVILRDKGLIKTAEETQRMHDITLQLKGALGENVTQINSETGELELNTIALEENIAAREQAAMSSEEKLVRMAAKTSQAYKDQMDVFNQVSSTYYEVKKAFDNIGGSEAYLVGLEQEKYDWLRKNANELSKSSSQQEQELGVMLNQLINAKQEYKGAGAAVRGLGKDFKEQSEAVISLGYTSDQANEKVTAMVATIKAETEAAGKSKDANEELKKTLQELIDKRQQLLNGDMTALDQAEVDTLNTKIKAIQELISGKGKEKDATEVLSNSLQGLIDQRDRLQEDKLAATDMAEVARINDKITALDTLIKTYETLSSTVNKMQTIQPEATDEEHTMTTRSSGFDAPVQSLADINEMLQITGASVITFGDLMGSTMDEKASSLNALYESLFGIDTALGDNAKMAKLFGDSLGGIGGTIDIMDGALMSMLSSLDLNSEAFDGIITKLQELQEEYAKTAEAEAMAANANRMINDAIVSSIVAVSQALATGANALDAIGEVVGSFMVQMGKAIIAYGVASEAFKQAIKISGIAAVVAGAALVVAGSLVKNLASKGFATGVVDIQGAGTETSDSIPVRVSKGESIITAKGTDKAPEALKEINEGRLTDREIFESKKSELQEEVTKEIKKDKSTITETSYAAGIIDIQGESPGAVGSKDKEIKIIKESTESEIKETEQDINIKIPEKEAETEQDINVAMPEPIITAGPAAAEKETPQPAIHESKEVGQDINIKIPEKDTAPAQDINVTMPKADTPTEPNINVTMPEPAIKESKEVGQDIDITIPQGETQAAAVTVTTPEKIIKYIKETTDRQSTSSEKVTHTAEVTDIFKDITVTPGSIPVGASEPGNVLTALGTESAPEALRMISSEVMSEKEKLKSITTDTGIMNEADLSELDIEEEVMREVMRPEPVNSERMLGNVEDTESNINVNITGDIDGDVLKLLIDRVTIDNDRAGI